MVEGVYVASVTPFRASAATEFEAQSYVVHVEWLAERGVMGVVPFGDEW